MEASVAAQAEVAAQNPAERAAFLSLNLNAGTAAVTDADLLLELEQWNELPAGQDRLRDGEYVLGVDLSGGSGMTGLVAIWPASGRAEFAGIFCEKPSLYDRGKTDSCDGYEFMHQAGDLLLVPGRNPAIPDVLTSAENRWGIPSHIVADKWRKNELFDAIDQLPEWNKATLILAPMSWESSAEDVRRFRACVSERWLAPVTNSLVIWQLSGAKLEYGQRGDQRLVRGRGRTSTRVDCVSALLLACGEADRQRKAPKPSWYVA